MSAKRFAFRVLHEQRKRADLGKVLMGRQVPIPHRYDSPFTIVDEVGQKAPIDTTLKLGGTTKPKRTYIPPSKRTRFLPLPSEVVKLRMPSPDDNVAFFNNITSNTSILNSLLKDNSFSNLGSVFGALKQFGSIASAINDAEYDVGDEYDNMVSAFNPGTDLNNWNPLLGEFAPPVHASAPTVPLEIAADPNEIKNEPDDDAVVKPEAENDTVAPTAPDDVAAAAADDDDDDDDDDENYTDADEQPVGQEKHAIAALSQLQTDLRALAKQRCAMESDSSATSKAKAAVTNKMKPMLAALLDVLNNNTQLAADETAKELYTTAQKTYEAIVYNIINAKTKKPTSEQWKNIEDTQIFTASNE